MHFTLEQLMALDAIARTGSFAAAAKVLHKVPSAISYNIQGLEEGLGVKLFDRSRRKAALTREGQRILQISQDVLTHSQTLNRVAAELRDGWESELHVVVDGALPMGPITRCVRRFAESDVPTSLRVDVEYQGGVLDRFNETPADLALILGLDGDGDEVGYECTPLPPLDMLLVTSPHHPLATAPFSPENQSIHAELVVRDASPPFTIESKAARIGGRNVVHLSDFHSKRIALLDAAGYGWIPRHLVEEDLAHGRLTVISTDNHTWTYHPQITLRQGEGRGRAARLFLQTLHDSLASDQPR
jgi:DNA-binding transcriptional LysR family regulator